MALPRPQQIAFTPGEIEYIAGNEKIKIIPNVRFPDISLIQVSLILDNVTWSKCYYRETFESFDHHYLLKYHYG